MFDYTPPLVEEGHRVHPSIRGFMIQAYNAVDQRLPYAPRSYHPRPGTSTSALNMPSLGDQLSSIEHRIPRVTSRNELDMKVFEDDERSLLYTTHSLHYCILREQAKRLLQEDDLRQERGEPSSFNLGDRGQVDDEQDTCRVPILY